MFQFNLCKRLGIRLKRQFDVLCPNCHAWGAMNTLIFTCLDKAQFCKVLSGKSYQGYSTRWSWCSNRNHPRFLYIGFTLTNLIYKDYLLSLIDCEWGVRSSIFLYIHIETKPPKCSSPLLAQQRKMSWGNINTAFLPDSALPVTAQMQNSTNRHIVLHWVYPNPL